MSSGKKYGIIAAIIIVVIVAAGFGYSKFSQWRATVAAQELALKEAKKSVAESTAGTEFFLKANYEPNDMTYAQLFDRVEDRSKKIEDAIIDVKAGDLPDGEKNVVTGYLDSLNDALQSMEMSYRKALNFSNSLDSAKAARDDYVSSPYNEYTDQMERDRMKKAVSEANDAASEVKKSAKDFEDRLNALQTYEKTNTDKLNGFSLVDATVLKKVIAKAQENLKAAS